MSDNSNSTDSSVGQVELQLAKIDLPAAGFKLERGGVLPELNVAYEAYGELTPARDNVIFICHALTGDAHVAGYYTDSAKDVGLSRLLVDIIVDVAVDFA